jgi:hypothetical protein
MTSRVSAEWHRIPSKGANAQRRAEEDAALAELDRQDADLPGQAHAIVDVGGGPEAIAHQHLPAPPIQAAPAKLASWPIFVAVNLMKVGLLLQRELMEEKIFSYITHWPGTQRLTFALAYLSVLEFANIPCTQSRVCLEASWQYLTAHMGRRSENAQGYHGPSFT